MPTEPITDKRPALTDKQVHALSALCHRYNVTFDESNFLPAFDLPPGYVAGWIGNDRIYVGCSPDGDISS
jgi:hypothetical protein